MLLRSAIEALGRRRIGPEPIGATSGFDDCDTKINDGPPSEGAVVTDGAPAKLSIASSVPTEQRANAHKMRGLNMPDWESELSFMEIPFYFWFYFGFYICE
jgi:hypothetical protein